MVRLGDGRALVGLLKSTRVDEHEDHREHRREGEHMRNERVRRTPGEALR
ncbi:unannotated protein [freshwater metagenome]|uniref:Unannotated protein n=1 Tax=freshwater metagenome TaxID=449393 RepID=A0A6J7N315_9ZZZZ